MSRGKDVAVLALGNFFTLGEKVCAVLREKGIDATLVNPRYITGVDTALMESLKSDHRVVVTLEDGAVEGGFGEKIARHFGSSDMKVLCYGVKKEFKDGFRYDEILTANRLTVPQITDDILSALK